MINNKEINTKLGSFNRLSHMLCYKLHIIKVLDIFLLVTLLLLLTYYSLYCLFNKIVVS